MPQTWIDLAFADGEYTFKLPLSQIVEIERKCGDGIGAIYARVVRGRMSGATDDVLPHEGAYKAGDLIEVIRHGLIGGNSGIVNGQPVKVSSHVANSLVDAYVVNAGTDRQPIKATWALAFTILYALIEGYSPPGEAEPADAPATHQTGSTSSAPTSTAPRSGSRSRTSKA